ncbi:MAG: hypothetical protein ACREUT_20325 [Steroidobacteraceae bacterium]
MRSITVPTALIVTRPFGTHQVGQQISDPAAIEAILKSSNHASVVPVKPLSPGAPPRPAAPLAG